MPDYQTYTFLIQVQNLEGNWGSLLEPHTGVPLQGTHGVVATTLEGFDDAAGRILRRFADLSLKRRVVFFEGSRLNETLLAQEAFTIVTEDQVV